MAGWLHGWMAGWLRGFILVLCVFSNPRSKALRFTNRFLQPNFVLSNAYRLPLGP
jgi:hypothetical protein